MYHHSTTSVCWSSFSEPESLVPVGTDTVALLCQNIVIFHDVKTQVKSYYAADTMSTCAGISLLRGHTNFPIFAIAENVLRPSIYIFNYPELDKINQLPGNTISSYVDMLISESADYLLALTAAPNHTLHLWNYRTGAHLAKVHTNKKCLSNCLFMTKNPEISLVQYSKWHQEIVVWELCQSAELKLFREMTTIQIGAEYDKSKFFCVTYNEVPYVVNDFGHVSTVSPGHFALQLEWKIPYPDHIPKAHRIFSDKNGFFVINDNAIFYIKKRNDDWKLCWKILNSTISVLKMVSNANGEMFAAAQFGNIYKVVQGDESGLLVGLSTTSCSVIEYSVVRGTKEEVVVILTEEGEVRAVDLAQMTTFSSIFIDNAICTKCHPANPYAAVGTTTGDVHFISFEKLRSPVILNVVHVDYAAIYYIQLNEHIAFLRDEYNGFHILECGYITRKFNVAMSLDRKDKETRNILQLFLLSQDCAMMFVSRENEKDPKLAKYMWMLDWNLKELTAQRREFELIYSYCDFTRLQPYSKEKIEFTGIRKNDFIFDLFHLDDSGILRILTSVRTYHYGHLNSVAGTSNILTSASQGVVLHFYSNKKHKKPYAVSKPVLSTIVPRLRKFMSECCKSKYLLILYTGGVMMVFRMPSLKEGLKENKRVYSETEEPIMKFVVVQEKLRRQDMVVVRTITPEDEIERNAVLEELNIIRQAMHELINYDISVTGQEHGVYRKFCLNEDWLQGLTERARKVFHIEHEQMLAAIDDQNRIKNWILDLIRSTKGFFSVKLRSVFSHVWLENYAMHPISQSILDQLDYFRFYDMDFNEDETEELQIVPKTKRLLEEEEGEEEEEKKKLLKRFVLEKDRSVFEHVMSKDFELQDINNVTFNQMKNENAKVQVLLIEALKQEFNKEFALYKTHKQDVFSDILATNESLRKIYNNMNCMLCLLHMEELKPPELSAPEWAQDENIEHIMTVDDSEITAINPRRKISTQSARKSARMLLWPPEYWKRAIMYMMDGVLEKLWEEEIKKTPQEPEFMKNKSPAEYSADERKIVREYEDKLMVLKEDRRKYLKMLKEDEIKVQHQKKRITQKLNVYIMEAAILKLKYDFAIRHEQLRSLNTQLTNYKRIQDKNSIIHQKKRMEKIAEYITTYTDVIECHERWFEDIKMKQENQIHKDRYTDRQFKGQYLNGIPVHLSNEMNKIYKRRPKLPSRIFSSSSVCSEMAERILSKKQFKYALPKELNDFLVNLDALDDPQNGPSQLDPKHWDNFVKLRRQKLENELRLKAIGYQMSDIQNIINFHTAQLNKIKVTRVELSHSIVESLAEYFEITQNRSLEFILTMGQVEFKVRNLATSFRNCMVMNVRDIQDINKLIRETGSMKIKAMHRVALFRRQVLYKEWEHKVVRANIEFLEYFLKLIENCKITHAFLEILHNWKKVEENKAASSAVGFIERKIEERIEGSIKFMMSIDKEIEYTRGRIAKVKSSSRSIDKQIANLQTEVTVLNLKRDVLNEEKSVRERGERFNTLRLHRNLIETVRQDYVQILELQTILELQRLRTYPTLGPAPQCGVPLE